MGSVGFSSSMSLLLYLTAIWHDERGGFLQVHPSQVSGAQAAEAPEHTTTDNTATPSRQPTQANIRPSLPHQAVVAVQQGQSLPLSIVHACTQQAHAEASCGSQSGREGLVSRGSLGQKAHSRYAV